MQWQFSSDTPIYSQLIRGIQIRIVAGVFPPGERLPSVRDLAAEAGVNPNTMQRALSELEREGLVYSARTAGRYVTDDISLIQALKRRLAEGKIEAFLREMRELGFTDSELLGILCQELKKEE